jgi:diacylglycerol kinase (ATP)
VVPGRLRAQSAAPELAGEAHGFTCDGSWTRSRVGLSSGEFCEFPVLRVRGLLPRTLLGPGFVPSKTLVVINPHSAGGMTGRRWHEVEPQLRASLGELDVQRTLGHRDAERIARDAVRAGVQRLVVAGGDGTVSEVVSGLLGAGVAHEAQVGILPMGTGRDLPRTLGVPGDVRSAIAALARGATRRIDASRITYRDRSGADRVVYSANVVSFGLSGLTVELVTRAPHFLGGSFAFLWGALESIVRYRGAGVAILADGQEVFDGRLVLGAAANGRYFGGGMQIAPDAIPDDGLLDLVVIGEMTKPALVAALPSLYQGTHLANPSVSVLRARVIEARPASADSPPVWFDVDGEGLGMLPIRIELLPRVVTLFGAEPAAAAARRGT